MKTSIALLLCGSFLLSGCVPTANPIYTPDDVAYDKDLLGKWVRPQDGVTVEFLRHTEQSYLLKYTTRKEGPLQFVAHLAEVDGVRFLDAYPHEGKASTRSIANFHFLPIHTVYLVKKTEPKLELSVIDVDWMERQMKNREIASAQIGSREVVTASTKELQEFLVKHQDRFTGSMVFSRP